jgi:hypothetical protein
LSQNKTATASNEYDSLHNAAKAVDGIYDSSDHTKWCTTTPVSTSWLQVDLGESCNISRYVVKHAGILEDPTLDTRDFKFQVSNNGTTWTDVDSVTSNTTNTTDHNVTANGYRYARLYITNPQTNTNWIGARIYEFQVYGYTVGSPSPTPSPTPTPAPTLLSQGKTATASDSYDSAHNAAKEADGIFDSQIIQNGAQIRQLRQAGCK